MEIIERDIESLREYERNAKIHSEVQIANLAESIRRFGFRQPIVIDKNGVIVAGHGRLAAARAAGLRSVPCVMADDLSEDDIKAYRVLDNKLSESPWDMALLTTELPEINLAGFVLPELPEIKPTDEYNDFVKKFTEHELTTDDCFTPANVYEAVKTWAVERFFLAGAEIKRPFYPGGDYEIETYGENCVVLDNPPFSILSQIVKFYLSLDIRFLLFAPALTLYSIASGAASYIPTGNNVRFANGADIAISFVTNMSEYKIETAPELYAAIKAADDLNRAEQTKALPVYVYPDSVSTSADSLLSKYGQRLCIRADNCTFVRALDAQREKGKAIYGGGFLLSEKAAAEKAAAEKAAAEKAAAEKWKLSDRELNIVKTLGGAT